MTAFQLALGAGALAGLGLALLVWQLVPTEPDLADTLNRLGPENSLLRPAPVPPTTSRDRLGLWLMRHVPVLGWVKVPQRELAMLRMPIHRYYGEKATYALLGLLVPPLTTAAFLIVGVHLPIAIPVVASLGLAAAMSFIPNYNVITDAAAARAEFTRALGAYIDLVALERNAGAAPRQALEYAAEVGDSWVFRRIGEELARSRWSGATPWEALTGLADELSLPDLADLADIMRLSGDEGAAVYQTLRARSAAVRTAILNNELAAANAAGERMSMPVAILALIFLIILGAPAVLRVLV